MRRRSIIIIAIVALLVVGGLTGGLVGAYAQGSPSLATVTPTQLLANVEQHAADVTSVSGAVTWKNDILGLSMLSSLGGQSAGDLTSLFTGGSGRLWVQNGKVRFEIQGSGGDTTMIGDSTGLWVYDSAKNTATQYTLPARPASSDAATTGTTEAQHTTTTDPVAAIDAVLQKLAPTAGLAVSDPVKVAGQDCYVLSLVPKATNTIFGSVQVSIDSKTYLPLKMEVYAKGDNSPVLSVGFTSVSYSQVDSSLFAFTPPATATVDHKTLTLPAGLGQSKDATATGSDSSSTTEPASAAGSAKADNSLTLAEAATQAGFTPLAPNTTDAALAFGGASVIPAQQVDLQSLLAKLPAGDLGGGLFGSESQSATASTKTSTAAPASDPLASLAAAVPSGPVTLGPAVIQRYGQGFGTIVFAQAQVPAELSTWLDQTLGSAQFSQLLTKTTTGSYTVYQLNTALSSMAIWDKNGMVFAAAGCVSSTDLVGFIASVR